ncbi:zeta toxin family protein (plasmid) [Streptomyces yangpuensis]|uniref:UDP-N-acetylglucosamine kinase n=1 Tax=Streptomyces yangpuensis TaxID=1648182 RepID=A0ABY5Q783_9ACTN|nr:zeta toxin family protein [Streptomyces yangpuensis]UUY52316.1 zeta toxin family protein [Streptomyces yangpuensis]
MTDPGVDRTYVLPQEQSDLIFEQIAQTLLAGAVPQDQPVATVLSAPPGAGKTVLAQDIKATYPVDARPVVIDVDAVRGFHPEYQRLRAAHGPQLADDLIQVQSRIWFESAIDYLVERGSHLIVEHGLRDREVSDRLLDKLSAEADGRAPYRIEAALLASSAATSELGILERYQVGHEMTGQGRIVAADLHDQRYTHLAEVADWLDADPRVSGQAVYQRGSAHPVHRNERLDSGELRLPVATRAVLEEVRNQPFTLEQSRAYLTLHASLQARMAPEWEPRLQRALEFAAPLLHPDADAGPITDRPAVTFGRYQIVSIAHLDTVRTILRDFPSLEIGVLDLEARPEQMPPVPEHLREFYAGCEANTSPAKNPMSAEERAGFWQATIDAVGLQDRVTVRVITRPELDPGGFNRMFPPERFDLVFPTASGEGFDLIRNASFEEIFNRKVRTVEPPLEYHTSDIRTAYRAGNEAWKNGFAPGGLEAFIAVDGPERLLTLVPPPPPPPPPAPGTVRRRVDASAARTRSTTTRPTRQGKEEPTQGTSKQPPAAPSRDAGPERRPGRGK